MSYTRSEFLKLTGLSGLAALTTGSIRAAETNIQSVDLHLGLASYTLRKFKLDDVIRMSKRVGLTNIALKDMHMPLNSSAEDIKKIVSQIRTAGLTLYGAGVIYMKTAQEVENAFAYAVH